VCTRLFPKQAALSVIPRGEGGSEQQARVVLQWLARLYATLQFQALQKTERALTTSRELVMRVGDPLVLPELKGQAHR
jgi:hypothetical protein